MGTTNIVIDAVAGLSTITAPEAVRCVEAGACMIDVRTAAEFANEHVPGSRLVPLASIGENLDEVLAIPAPRLLLCGTGKRATQARRILEAHQVPGCCVVVGGLRGFVDAGGETVLGQGMISLERQVRIAAGLLVLLGVLGGLLYPACYLLAALVGAGLVFAGITDWCGMGLLLARAPWNRKGGAR